MVVRNIGAAVRVQSRVLLIRLSTLPHPSKPYFIPKHTWGFHVKHAQPSLVVRTSPIPTSSSGHWGGEGCTRRKVSNVSDTQSARLRGEGGTSVQKAILGLRVPLEHGSSDHVPGFLDVSAVEVTWIAPARLEQPSIDHIGSSIMWTFYLPQLVVGCRKRVNVIIGC